MGLYICLYYSMYTCEGKAFSLSPPLPFNTGSTPPLPIERVPLVWFVPVQLLWRVIPAKQHPYSHQRRGSLDLKNPSPYYWTIWQSDTNLTFEYQTSPAFRWLLYNTFLHDSVDSFLYVERFFGGQKGCMQPSRGGLEVEVWTDNSHHPASVGLNPV